MSYRFQDIVSNVNMDYIIFFYPDYIDIDLKATVRIHVAYDRVFHVPIVNNSIDWSDIDDKLVSTSCQQYCNKIQKLKAFS